jgi:predicted lipoprotein with Yx(FWY)xxD motif
MSLNRPAETGVVTVMGTVSNMRAWRRLAPWPRLAGAGLLAASGAIHLDLYLTGYRSIPVIGPLFLAQVAAAFAVAAAVVVAGHWLAAGAGAALALGTLGGYLLAIWPGLFGFREVRTTAGILAGLAETGAFAALAIAALAGAGQADVLAAARPRSAQRAARGGPRPAGAPGELPPAGWRRIPAGGHATAGVLGVAAAALVLLGLAVGLAGPRPVTGATAGGARVRLTTVRVGGVTVLANGARHTLYWFGPDTPTTSRCNGECANYWPPVPGPVTAGSGVTGRLGIITRADGSAQATYNGHPLYTYIGDSGPGQAHGNNIDLNGGRWHAVTITG